MALILLIFLGVIFQGVAMFRSSMMYDFGVGYWGPLARDGVWHEALVSELMRHIPPFNPGMAGEMLTNYHYYYDLLVSLVARVGLPATFLIYKLFPILFSVLLGIGTYKLANILFKDRRTSLLAVFFAYFGSSFGWLVDTFKGKEIGGESAFWANQPVSMNLNPPFAISLIIIIFTTLLVYSYLSKPKLLTAVGIIALAGSLIGFKVYAGAIFVAALLVLGIKRFIFDRDVKFLVICCLSLAISLIILAPSSENLGLLEFKPLWLVDTMIDAGDRVGIPNFTSRRFAYAGESKWLHYAAIEIICLAIFFIGNLGTRVIGVLGLRRKQFTSDVFIFIFAMMAVAVIPPLLFVQRGNAWNIVQFFYYFMFFAGLFAAYSLRKFSLVAIVIILLLTPISSVATFRSWLYPNPPAYLPKDEYVALQFLKTQSDGVVLKHQFDKGVRSNFKDPYPLAVYADNAYVAAFSDKSVFVEDVEQQIVLNTNYYGRLEDAQNFFIGKDTAWSNEFLLKNNINYVYLPKIYSLPMAEGEYNMLKIFENESVNIYKVE